MDVSGATMDPQGRGHALDPRGQVLVPPDEFLVPNILEKIIFKFQGIWRTFIFGVFFIAWIILKQRENIFFALFNINNRK